MKILLAGGGTGGHFYPLIAIAEELIKIADREHIVDMKIFYMADSPYDKAALAEHNIKFIKISAGKMRIYFSLENILDIFKTFFGTIGALWEVYKLYPDIIVAKGAYASFPVLFAARILRIPILIHESDSVPGRVNRWASKFATRIAVSFEEAGQFFPKEKVAWTGQPIREELRQTVREGTFEYLKLNPAIPVILILGGSQGAEVINNVILDILPDLVEKYQILHQAGRKNIAEVEIRSKLILKDNPNADRYRAFPYFNKLALKMTAGAASLIISRAGSGLFEIASWGVPSILIPITESHGDHQRRNAFNYARSGGAMVIEEANLTQHLLIAEINKLITDEKRRAEMSMKASAFIKKDAATKIAQEVLSIALSHEK